MSDGERKREVEGRKKTIQTNYRDSGTDEKQCAGKVKQMSRQSS